MSLVFRIGRFRCTMQHCTSECNACSFLGLLAPIHFSVLLMLRLTLRHLQVFAWGCPWRPNPCLFHRCPTSSRRQMGAAPDLHQPAWVAGSTLVSFCRSGHLAGSRYPLVPWQPGCLARHHSFCIIGCQSLSPCLLDCNLRSFTAILVLNGCLRTKTSPSEPSRMDGSHCCGHTIWDLNATDTSAPVAWIDPWFEGHFFIAALGFWTGDAPLSKNFRLLSSVARAPPGSVRPIASSNAEIFTYHTWCNGEKCLFVYLYIYM